VSKSLRSVALVLVPLALAACSSRIPRAQPVRTSFLPQTVDFLDDVGRGASIALDSQGNPHIAYIGLVQKPEPNVIPPARPATAPALPAVLIASQANGVFSHGFVVQTDISSAKPTEVPVDENSTTGIAIAQSGSFDVVWNQVGGAETQGVWMATAPNAVAPFGAPVRVSPVEATSPVVATDQQGNPAIAFASTTSTSSANATGQTVIDVATPDKTGKTFNVQQVDAFDVCPGICTSVSLAMAWTPAGYLIAFTDPGTKTVSLAEQSGTSWKVHQIDQDVDAGGVGLSALAGSPVLVSYLTDTDARVASAANPSASWTIRRTPEFNVATQPGPGAGTAVSQAQNTTYLAYVNPDDGAVHLASARGTNQLSAVSTPGTANGLYPALAVTDVGVVSLAWYDSEGQDLMLGLYQQQLTALAMPPSPVPYTPPAGGSTGGCAKNTVEVVAPVGAAGSGYATTDVSASSGDFTLCFDNQDAGVAHNVAIFKDKATADSGGQALASDDLFAGPKVDSFDVKGLAPGSYYFHCDAHPPTMFGTLTVK